MLEKSLLKLRVNRVELVEGSSLGHGHRRKQGISGMGEEGKQREKEYVCEDIPPF